MDRPEQLHRSGQVPEQEPRAYAEHNGAVLPWFRELDVKLLQDIFTEIGPNRHTLQLSVDIFNVGNLLNKNWGAIRATNRVNPLKFDGYDAQGRPTSSIPTS